MSSSTCSRTATGSHTDRKPWKQKGNCVKGGDCDCFKGLIDTDLPNGSCCVDMKILTCICWAFLLAQGMSRSVPRAKAGRLNCAKRLAIPTRSRFNRKGHLGKKNVWQDVWIKREESRTFFSGHRGSFSKTNFNNELFGVKIWLHSLNLSMRLSHFHILALKVIRRPHEHGWWMVECKYNILEEENKSPVESRLLIRTQRNRCCQEEKVRQWEAFRMKTEKPTHNQSINYSTEALYD